MFQNKYMKLVAAMLMILLVAVGCGKTEVKEEAKAKSEPKEMTVTDAMGEVTIPADVKRVLAPNMEDALVALGVTPAAQWSIGTTVHDYLQGELKDVEKIGWDMPLEQTIKAEPDLIIFGSASAIQNGQYEEYKKIAPTYVFKDEVGADWKQQLQVMGQLLNKEDAAKEGIAKYEEKAKQASADVKAKIGDETAAILWVIGDQYYLFENTRYAANVLYGDLGVAQPKMIQELPKAEATWKPVSVESLSALDADHIFLVSKPTEAGLAKLKSNAVWTGLKAVKAGNVYEVKDTSHWTLNGLIANGLTMDAIVEALTK